MKDLMTRTTFSKLKTNDRFVVLGDDDEKMRTREHNGICTVMANGWAKNRHGKDVLFTDNYPVTRLNTTHVRMIESENIKKHLSGVDSQITNLEIRDDGETWTIYKVTPCCSYAMLSFSDEKSAWNMAMAIGDKAGWEITSK